MNEDTLQHGFRHLALGETPSTNAECLERARAGDPGRLWITARRQTQGRGSRGRGWVSEPGNLYASLLLRDLGSAQQVATLTFAVSVALRGAIAAFAGERIVALKWPNDVLLDGRKVSGVLLESHRLDQGGQAVIIGIGVNCATFPPATDFPATSLAAEGMEVEPAGLFERLADEMAMVLARWDGGNDFAQVREQWLAHAVGMGEPVVARLPDGEFRGTFENIDEVGRLMLRERGGRLRKISTADIFFAAQMQPGMVVVDCG